MCMMLSSINYVVFKSNDSNQLWVEAFKCLLQGSKVAYGLSEVWTRPSDAKIANNLNVDQSTVKRTVNSRLLNTTVNVAKKPYD